MSDLLFFIIMYIAAVIVFFATRKDSRNIVRTIARVLAVIVLLISAVVFIMPDLKYRLNSDGPTNTPGWEYMYTIKPGDTLYIVNCVDNLSMRSKPDSTDNLKAVSSNEQVQFLNIAENGYYHVKYGNIDGYILAAYLSQENYKYNPNSAVFSQTDLQWNGIVIGESYTSDLEKQFGKPNSIYESGEFSYWIYDEYSVKVSKITSKIMNVTIIGNYGIGPRHIYVGMDLAQVLQSFPMLEPSILRYDDKQDTIFYSKENEKLVAPYAYIQNDKYAGNGILKFVDLTEKAHMDINVKNGFASKISVYID